MITGKLINEFLVFLYTEHNNNFGESIASLSTGGMLLLDKTFSDKYPDAVINLDEITIKDLTYSLGKELESQGYASVDNLSVFLTKKGYEKAWQLKHPIKYFIKSQWKWLFATFALLIGGSWALYTYIEQVDIKAFNIFQRVEATKNENYTYNISLKNKRELLVKSTQLIKQRNEQVESANRTINTIEAELEHATDDRNQLLIQLNIAYSEKSKTYENINRLLKEVSELDGDIKLLKFKIQQNRDFIDKFSHE